MSNIFQSVWVGSELSKLEQLCLKSFVDNGHEFHLYVYEDVKNIPDGIIVKDGREILPESMIFYYSGHKSVSGFSNFFRYKVLYDKGGFWTDMDMFVLKPILFKDAFVFSSEEVLPLDRGNTHINAGIIKTPKNSPVAKHMFDVCMSKEKEKLVWGEIGPRLVKSTVEMFYLQSFVKSYDTFCPIPGCRWDLLFSAPTRQFEKYMTENVCAVHMWNEMIRRSGVDKNSNFHPDSFFEKMKRKHDIK